MDVWQLIGRDHANIEQLIHDAPRALNGPGVIRSRERLLGDMIDELVTHASAIEASLYAPLAQWEETSSIGRDRQERLLDDGLEETFPASDPVSAQRFT